MAISRGPKCSCAVPRYHRRHWANISHSSCSAGALSRKEAGEHPKELGDARSPQASIPAQRHMPGVQYHSRCITVQQGLLSTQLPWTNTVTILAVPVQQGQSLWPASARPGCRAPLVSCFPTQGVQTRWWKLQGENFASVYLFIVVTGWHLQRARNGCQVYYYPSFMIYNLHNWSLKTQQFCRVILGSNYPTAPIIKTTCTH